VGAEGDTVRMIATKNGLMALPGRDSVPLRPAGENVFFIQPDKAMDIRFREEGKDNMSFVLWVIAVCGSGGSGKIKFVFLPWRHH
jgi:hypothetical protein